jgi:hypothetical protein
MRTSEWGVRQLGQALEDHAASDRIRAVAADGNVLGLDDGSGDQHVTDNWLRSTFPPPGRPVAPPAPETAHEKFLEALAALGEQMEALRSAARRLRNVEGTDGHALVDSDGVDPAHADEWLRELIDLQGLVQVWKATHIARHGVTSSTASSGWDEEDEDDGQGEDHAADELDDEESWS